MGFNSKLMKPMSATEPMVTMLFHKTEERRISIMELAARTGTDYVQLQRYRRGLSVPRVDRFREMAAAAGYDVVLVLKENTGVLRRGTKVRKREGYGFPGTIVSKFETTSGATRYVVEATGEGYKGMLHIFNGEQIARRNDGE